MLQQQLLQICCKKRPLYLNNGLPLNKSNKICPTKSKYLRRKVIFTRANSVLQLCCNSAATVGVWFRNIKNCTNLLQTPSNVILNHCVIITFTRITWKRLRSNRTQNLRKLESLNLSNTLASPFVTYYLANILEFSMLIQCSSIYAYI